MKSAKGSDGKGMNALAKLRSSLGGAVWKNPRLRAVMWTAGAAAALVFLASGLAQLELLPGKPLPMIREESSGGSIAGLPGGDLILFILRAFYFVGLACLPILLIYLILNPKARKQFFKDLLRATIFMLILYLAGNLIRSMQQQALEGQEGGAGAAPQTLPQLEIAQFSPQTPPWLVLAASAFVALLITGLAGLAVWLLLRRRPVEQPLRRIAQQAQAAMEALQAGGDLTNVVVRCYAEMSRVLSEQREIDRPLDMTPREFEAALMRNGLPGGPVQTLTRIFEEVRYGMKVPGEQDERRALESLEAIVAACGSPLGGAL